MKILSFYQGKCNKLAITSVALFAQFVQATLKNLITFQIYLPFSEYHKHRNVNWNVTMFEDCSTRRFPDEKLPALAVKFKAAKEPRMFASTRHFDGGESPVDCVGQWSICR